MPKDTTITRLAEGVVDSQFGSFFEGFYENTDKEFGREKDLDLTTTAN